MHCRKRGTETMKTQLGNKTCIYRQGKKEKVERKGGKAQEETIQRKVNYMANN